MTFITSSLRSNNLRGHKSGTLCLHSTIPFKVTALHYKWTKFGLILFMYILTVSADYFLVRSQLKCWVFVMKFDVVRWPSATRTLRLIPTLILTIL